jgi:hypothetical protein
MLLNNNVLLTLHASGNIGRNIIINFSSTSFQSKVAMINKIPFQKVAVGDINIACIQLGKNNTKSLILITGLGATMDM